jgi:hypothetical protein
MVLTPNQLWRTAGMVLCVLLIAGEAAAQICINVDLRFDGRDPSPITVQSMQDEASVIWQRYGVHIQWPASRSNVQCPAVHGSFDVLVQYQPSSGKHAPALSVLGSTHVVPTSIDHVGIYVDYDETLQALQVLPEWQLFLLLGHPDIGPVDVGRALGRILAHEIGHVVLSAPRHQAFGLMRRSFDSADLATPSRATYTLSKKEIERLALRERQLRAYAAPDSLPSSWNFHGCAEVNGH